MFPRCEKGPLLVMSAWHVLMSCHVISCHVVSSPSHVTLAHLILAPISRFTPLDGWVCIGAVCTHLSFILFSQIGSDLVYHEDRFTRAEDGSGREYRLQEPGEEGGQFYSLWKTPLSQLGDFGVGVGCVRSFSGEHNTPILLLLVSIYRRERATRRKGLCWYRCLFVCM